MLGDIRRGVVHVVAMFEQRPQATTAVEPEPDTDIDLDDQLHLSVFQTEAQVATPAESAPCLPSLCPMLCHLPLLPLHTFAEASSSLVCLRLCLQGQLSTLAHDIEPPLPDDDFLQPITPCEDTGCQSPTPSALHLCAGLCTASLARASLEATIHVQSLPQGA